jgi:tetratricopeptide (TPR) repeat protein
MYNFGISLLLSIIVTAALGALVGLNPWIASAIGLAAFAASFILITRLVMKKIGVLMETAQRDLQAGRGEKAIKTLQSGFKYAPWQFYVKGQLNAQIGMVLYLKRDFAEAFEYLQKGFVRHWIAMGMLAICYMKRNKPAKMIDTFEKATSATKKEPLLWNLYGYCLERVGEKEKAIAVMEKGVKKVGGHELLQANLDALKEGRKMRMLGWGDLWYQFHLESTGAIIRQQTKAIQGRRKIVRR